MRVIKDFFTTVDVELCVAQDEYLQVLEVVDRIWVRCQTEHKIGLVPSAHLTSVDGIPYLTVDQSLFLSISDWDAERKGDIALKRWVVVCP